MCLGQGEKKEWVTLFQDINEMFLCSSFTASNIIHMMDNTNRIFGGLSPNVTKVYFTDGALDPAKSIGVMEPFGEDIYVDMIPSKCSYLNPSIQKPVLTLS